MGVRVTYIAIAIGGACGAFAALVGPAPAPAPSATSPLRPIAALPEPPRPARALAIASESSGVALAPRPTADANPSSSAISFTSAPPVGSGLAAGLSLAPAPLSSAETTAPPASKQSLLRAEMHCDQKDAVACILAARAYEAGTAGATDAEKALKYRKIALTLWIGQCDHNSASACAILADMYRAGRGVPQSDRNADALVVRARELCHFNDAPACHQLPPAP